MTGSALKGSRRQLIGPWTQASLMHSGRMLAQALEDRDVALWDALEAGVPTGVHGDIPSHSLIIGRERFSIQNSAIFRKSWMQDTSRSCHRLRQLAPDGLRWPLVRSILSRRPIKSLDSFWILRFLG